MNSDDLILRQESYGSLTTKGSPLTVTEFDNNNISFYKDFEALRVTVGVPAYDIGTTYNNDANDSTTETFATHSNKFWQWINVVDGNSVPSEGSDWTEVFPTVLAHEKDKDNKLKTLDGFTVIVDDSVYPRAEVELIDAVSGWKFAAGVQMISGMGQSSLGALNTATGENFSVRLDNGTIEVKHTDSSNNITAGVAIESGKILFRTPDQLSGSAVNNYVVKLIDATTGEIEFVDPASTGLRIGFVDYNDLTTQTTPISFLASTPTLITNDSLGPNTITTYLPSGVTSIWNAVSNQFDWSDLELGDMIDIRLDLDVTTTAVNQDVRVELYMGVGASEYPIMFTDVSYKTSGTYKINRFNGVYMGNTLTLNNPAELRIISSDPGSLVVNGWYCKIIKN